VGDRRLRYRAEQILTVGALALLRSLPRGAAYGLGGGLGRLAGAILSGRSSIARRNLASALPQLPEVESRRILRDLYRNLGWTLTDLARMGSWDESAWRDLVEVEGREHLEEIAREGRGIFLSAHFGNWELLGGILVRTLPLRPAVVVARPLKNPRVDAIVNRLREATGIEVLPHRGSFLRLLGVLKAGGGVGILLDQHTAPHEAVLCNFFGRPAGTNYGLALLAMKSGAPVLPVFMVRTGRNRHRIIFLPPMRLADPGREGRSAALQEFTQRCTDVIEAMVRRHPDQWFWVHRRWKAETHLSQYKGVGE
jgi:KDO2-lipid IV(A) lauroyltransferase